MDNVYDLKNTVTANEKRLTTQKLQNCFTTPHECTSSSRDRNTSMSLCH